MMPFPYRSPPVVGSWDNPVGMGVKGQGLLLGKKQPIQPHTYSRSNILKPEFVNEPISNIDLKKWCDYLNIKINGIFSRNEHMPKNHCPCIIKLDDVC